MHSLNNPEKAWIGYKEFNLNGSEIRTEYKTFANYFLRVCKDLKEPIRRSTWGGAKENNKSYVGLDINFNGQNIEKLTLWAKKGENKFTQVEKIITVQGEGEYTFYDKNPNQFKEIKREGVLAKELNARPTGTKLEGATAADAADKIMTFHEVKAEGETFYLLGDEEKPDEPEGINYLDFPKFFTVMEESGKEDSIICDHNLIVKNITKDELTFNDLLNVYKNTSEESKEIREKLRRLVCMHHLEWKKELYNKEFAEELKEEFALDEERLKHLQDKMGKQDLCATPDGKNLEDERLPPKKQVWFAHPIHFINHLDKAGLLDRTFNPYYGESKKTVNKKPFDCIDNPGFAPLYDSENDNKEGNVDEDTKQTFVHDGKRYGVITGLFNDDYTRFYSGYSFVPHEGVDYRGGEGREIISFIYGRVIYAGWTDTTYGRVLIVANEKEKGIYLLGHLSDIANGIEKGSFIEPGQEVAYVGGSAYALNEDTNTIERKENHFATHLHVSYYDVQYNEQDEKKGFYSLDGAFIGYNKNECDPFNHGIVKEKIK